MWKRDPDNPDSWWLFCQEDCWRCYRREKAPTGPEAVVEEGRMDEQEGTVAKWGRIAEASLG